MKQVLKRTMGLSAMAIAAATLSGCLATHASYSYKVGSPYDSGYYYTYDQPAAVYVPGTTVYTPAVPAVPVTPVAPGGYYAHPTPAVPVVAQPVYPAPVGYQPVPHRPPHQRRPVSEPVTPKYKTTIRQGSKNIKVF